MTHTMVVGTTEPQDFQLLDDGVAIDGSGLTIGLDWRGTDPTGSPAVAWLVQASGTVRVTSVGTMAVGSYPFRFSLTDGAGKIGYCPNAGVPNTWRVVDV